MKKTVRLNQCTGLLKLIAIATMFIDHLGAMIFPQIFEMRLIGRLAFPIFAYCIAVGAVYTHSMGKYCLRMLIMAVISQPFYVLAMNHLTPAMRNLDFAKFPLQSAVTWYMESLNYGNIMFALLLGLLFIWCLQERTYALAAVCAVAIWFLAPYLQTSYGWKGVALMVLFYVLIDSPVHSFVCVAAFMAWGGFYGGTSTRLFAPQIGAQAYAMLALPLIYLPITKNIKVNKWVFYIFYPAHLALIYALQIMPR